MKRRKSTRSDAGSSPQEKIVKTAVKEKVSVDILNIDEKDAEKSDAASDVKSYRMTCDEIKKLIEEINDLKSEGKKCNAIAYHEACDSHLIVQIHGDIEAAKAVLEEKPIIKPDRNSLTLVFSYLPTLNIVTATPSLSIVDPGEQPILATSSLLSPDSVLDSLFPGDHGNSPPNPTNQFQLTKVGHTPVTAKSQLSTSHMEETISALRKRMLARLALHKQLASLEECKIPTIETPQPLFPLHIKSVLKSWKPIAYVDFIELPHARTIVAEGLIAESDMCYIAEIQRDSKAKLLAGVVLYQDYPINPPLFCLCIVNNGKVLSDEMIKLMEAEVNVHYHDMMEVDSPNSILTNQLKRLQMCFDVLIDCGYLNSDYDMEQLRCQKLLVRGLKGRMRSLPFKYDSSQGLFMHR
ncbi:hypothetical protein QZH41_008097 [Actinostola sp. cb2023]|nr:hypothetical protein QZH41_008097 [Actinostola sp. cb2023]